MLSIIIPTYNEAEQIANTILLVKQNAGEKQYEIIVVDGGSNDETISIAKAAGAKTFISNKKGRAAQMNYGAKQAKYDVLYFLHADSIPPNNFLQYIFNAIDRGYSSGCFRLQFDYNHWFLKANAWFTKFDVNAVRFGDQSLFVTANVFNKCGGFSEDLYMMEDQEIIHRLKKFGRFIVMNNVVTTSARKYHDNGIYRMQAIFFRILFLYYMGYSQERLLKLYKRLIRKNKL
ncbi:MAG: TIGR04283 family arsenosugar biosynthesis glycosyltransferase [Parafilimonas sp.]